MREDSILYPDLHFVEYGDGSWKALRHPPMDEPEESLVPSIDADKCRGCTLCIRKCPIGAIAGERRRPHVIDEALCISCMACIQSCKFEAINGSQLRCETTAH